MPTLSRRGATLAELLLAVVLGGLVGAAALASGIAALRGGREAAERGGTASAVHAAAALISAELRPLGAGPDGDLVAIGDSMVRYRALRVSGVACAAGGAELRYRPADASAVRLPQAGRDSVLVRSAADTGGWRSLAITAVDEAACAGGAAVALAVTADSGLGAGLPFRVFETAQLELYGGGAERALGLRAVSNGEPVQPAVGRLAPGGLRLEWLDSAGVPTPDPAAVRRVSATIRGRTPPLARGGGAPLARKDSTTLHLTLRSGW